MPAPGRGYTFKQRGDLHRQVVFSSFERNGSLEGEHPFVLLCAEQDKDGFFKVNAFFGTSDRMGNRHKETGRYYTLKKKEYPFLKNDTHFDT